MNYQTPCTNWAEMVAISHPEEDLSPSEYAAFEKHVAQCSNCAAVRKRYKIMAAQVRALPDVKPLSSSSLEFLHQQKEQYKGVTHPDVVVNSEDTRMICKQVEELLSAYLDDALAQEDRREVAAHLQICTNCSALLADFSRNDALLSHLPGTFDAGTEVQKEWTAPRLPAKSPRQNPAGRPQLVAIPGGRSILPTAAVNRQSTRQRRSSRRLAVLFVSIAAVLIMAFAMASLLRFNFWLYQIPTAAIGAITPPTGPQQCVPLLAGMRFVFLRQGTLWSVLSDGSRQADRLTPATVTVAENWVVSPAQAGSSAGDKLAYIDLQGAFVHVIRSDGQQDTIVGQPLLKAGVQPAAVWDTGTGATILNSLAWSQDGSMLAFVADPAGTGQTKLYIYSTETGTAQVVPSGKGSVSHPVWSPDGMRLAFEVTDNGVVSILDYNTQNHGVLTITSGINSQGTTGDSVLALDWSPDLNAPAVTWSVGQVGHAHSIWVQQVNVSDRTAPRALAKGNYSQAIYSRNGHDGLGSWLLVTSVSGRAADLLRLDLSVADLVSLTSGKQISFAQWSPDGLQVDYLDAVSSGTGTFHVLNFSTGIDSLIAMNVADEPTPAWSADSQELVYSVGTQTIVVSLEAHKSLLLLKLRGIASAFVWSATSPNILIVALSNGQQGIYLVDTQHNTSLQLDRRATSGPIEWSEVP